jgi:hypothetical protein
MSTNAPSKIIQNGIVFHYDTVNVKSYKGQPTTNLNSDPFALSGNPGSVSWGGYEYNITRTNDIPNNAMADISPYWIKCVCNGTSSGRAAVLGVGSLTTGVDYCISAYVFTGTSNITSIAWNSHNGGVSLDYGASSYGSSDVSRIKRIYRIFRSVAGSQLEVLQTNGSVSVGDTFYITGVQCEQQSYPTQLVSGTRSNTNGLVDLTGNCTVNLNSSSFDSSANITFNGSSCVTVDDTAAIALSGDKSFCMWINLAADSGGCGFGGKSNGTVAGMSLGYGWNSNGFMSLNWNSSNSPYLAKDLTRDVGKWVYLAAVQSGGTRYIYAMDASGIRSSSASGGTHSWSNSLPLKIGRINDHTAMPSGTKIDYVSVYNRALTQDEVLQNFNRTKSRFGM